MPQISTFDTVIDLSNDLLSSLAAAGIAIPDDSVNVPWKDYSYFSDTFRRAHVNIVDARADRNLWMMHCCIFPHINDPSPIFGLDIIAGPSRISGAFHDFSSTADSEHFMMKWFAASVDELVWKKPRELPDWATEIFSPSIVAVGAVNSQEEIDQLISLFKQTLDYYLTNVGLVRNWGQDYTHSQNRYCHFQKKNPHNPRFMQLLGLSAEEADSYVENIMFPEIK